MSYKTEWKEIKYISNDLFLKKKIANLLKEKIWLKKQMLN